MKVEVTINGVAYPCRATMGAMLRFKKETGKEVTEIVADSFTELATYLYCCVASACAADKIEFKMGLMEFADSVSPDMIMDWAAQMQTTDESAAANSKKKE